MDADSLSQLDKPELIALVLALEARVAALEQCGVSPPAPPKEPDNSSLPPSSAPKANRPEKTRRRRKGRPGTTRVLCPSPDHVRDLPALRCAGCKTAVPRGDQTVAHAYDHTDIPPIKPVVTRVNPHAGGCPCCGQRMGSAPSPHAGRAAPAERTTAPREPCRWQARA